MEGDLNWKFLKRAALETWPYTALIHNFVLCSEGRGG